MKKKISLLMLALSVVTYGEIKYSKEDANRIEKVKEFTNNVLKDGKSEKNPTPLIADGINIVTKEPVKWVYPNGREAKISNFANQQNFLRTLNGLTIVTGDKKYKEEAIKISKYFMDNFTDKNGLFYWGGHRFVNLETLALEGPEDKNQVHELKNLFPYYDFLYSVNPEKTQNYIKAFWNAHVEDWKTLDMGRHGKYEKKFDKDIFRVNKPVSIVDPKLLPTLPKTKGLTFINSGSDLILSAYKLYGYTGEQGAKDWGRNLILQYHLAKNPKTGAPVYQFSAPERRDWPPKSDADTNSKFGDRAERQFGPEFGAIAQEGNVLFKGNQRSIVVDNALVEMEIALKNNDKEIQKWAVENLKNYYKIAFDYQTGELKPVWNDGTDMTDYKLVRDGYYGKKDSSIKRTKIDSEDYMLPLVIGYRISKNAELLKIARIMGKNLGLGDIGDGKTMELAYDTKNSSPFAIFVLIELYKGTKNENYIKLARKIGDNIVNEKFVNGYFLENKDLLNAKVDSLEAFALVSLDAVLKGKEKSMPSYLARGGYIHGEHIESKEGNSVYDKDVIYKIKR